MVLLGMSKSNTAPRPRAARALAAFAGLAGWAVVGGALVGVVGCNDAAKPDPQAAASASGSANRGSRTAAASCSCPMFLTR